MTLIFINGHPYELIDETYYPAVTGGAGEETTPALGDGVESSTSTGETAEGGTGVTSTPDTSWWKTAVPTELHNATDWSKFKTVGDALKSYAELEKYRGDSVRIPKEDATPEEWGKFYDKVRPATPEGYNVSFPDVGGTVNWPDGDKQWVTKLAHSLGLSQRQVQGFVQAHSERLSENAKSMDVQRREAIVEIEKEYGATFKRDVALANRALQWAGGDDLLTFVKESGIGAEPVFIRSMLKIGKRFADENVIVGEVSGVMTKDEALARIANMRAEAGGAFNDPRHPGHREAVAEMQRLYSLAYN